MKRALQIRVTSIRGDSITDSSSVKIRTFPGQRPRHASALPWKRQKPFVVTVCHGRLGSIRPALPRRLCCGQGLWRRQHRDTSQTSATLSAHLCARRVVRFVPIPVAGVSRAEGTRSARSRPARSSGIVAGPRRPRAVAASRIARGPRGAAVCLQGRSRTKADG